MKRILAILMVAALTGCTQIDTGNVGVESTLGQFKKETLPAGVYFTLFKRMIEVSAKELPLSLNDLKPQTSDKITLADMDVDLYVQIDAGKAVDIITRWPGDLLELPGEGAARIGMNYVTRQAREIILNSVTSFGSADVHLKRTELSAKIVQQLQKSLDDDAGKGWFFVRSANIKNLVTDPALEASIKASANAQFEEQRKIREIEVAKKEADRKRIEAQGDADAIRIRATAISVQGGREYVELEAIKKWNGVLPTTQAGGVTPFIHVK